MTAAGAVVAAAVAVAVAAVGGCRSAPSASAEAGKALYTENGCASCHGVAGHGDGPVSPTLEPPPRDFRDTAAFKQGVDAGSIADTIANGVAAGSAAAGHDHHHGQAMPRFEHLSEQERQSLALYVISLRAQDSRGERR